MNIKEKFEQSKTWVKEHELDIMCGSITIGSIIGLCIIGKEMYKFDKTTIGSAKKETVEEVTDLGKDCVMRFFVKETGEQIGKDILCTESFAMDMQDCL